MGRIYLEGEAGLDPIEEIEEGEEKEEETCIRVDDNLLEPLPITRRMAELDGDSISSSSSDESNPVLRPPNSSSEE